MTATMTPEQTTRAIANSKRRGAALAAKMTDASRPHLLSELRYALAVMDHPETDELEVVRLAEYAARLAKMVQGRAAHDANVFAATIAAR